MMKRHWAPIYFHEQICHFCDRPRKPRPLIQHFLSLHFAVDRWASVANALIRLKAVLDVNVFLYLSNDFELVFFGVQSHLNR